MECVPGVDADPDLFAVADDRIYILGTRNRRKSLIAAPEKLLMPRKNVAIFLFDGVELLDFAGPGEVFAAADQFRAFNVYTVAVSEDELHSQQFLTIKPQYAIADSPRPDILVLPGGKAQASLSDARVFEWIQNSASVADVVMSVCTGAFLLAKAGLLDGMHATTHWASIQRLRMAAPKATVHADRRIVDNGKIVTCAGVSAGIDGALHVVERLQGHQVAIDTARYMEYRWEATPGTHSELAN